MKIYSTARPGTLLNKAIERLLNDGFSRPELPYWDIEDAAHHARRLRMGTVNTASEYWSANMHLHTDAVLNTVRSGHRPNRQGNGDPDVYAATFNQWGLVLGALFDVAHGGFDPGDIRVAGYDPLSKYAARRPNGERFEFSKDMFHWQTCDMFTQRARLALDHDRMYLTCNQHKWGRADDRGVQHCTKCAHPHRFVWYWMVRDGQRHDEQMAVVS